MTLAIGGIGSKLAFFSHSAGTAHGAPPEGTPAGEAGAYGPMAQKDMEQQ